MTGRAKNEAIKASNDNGNQLQPCPICGKPADAASKPFCSKRCANVDLHRWLSGSYAIPALPEEEESTGLEDGEDTE